MLILLLIIVLTVPAFAITEAEVEAQVSATSRETVTGNVLIWFLCAIGFLKVSQKIDSFMASLGVNVGHTGGSMLAEAMIATRGVAKIAGAFGGGVRHSGGGSSGGASPGTSGPFGGFLKGGLAGVVSRKVTSDAVKTATTSASSVNTVKSTATEAASQSRTIREQQASTAHKADTQTVTHQETQTASAHSASAERIAQTAATHSTSTEIIAQTAATRSTSTDELIAQTAAAHSSTETITQTAQQTEMSAAQIFQQAEHTAQQSNTQTISQTSHTASTITQADKQTAAPGFKGVGLGGAIFAKSLLSGGSFANDIIGTVAKGDIRSTGSITGDLAAQSLHSYLGHAGEGASDKPPLTFSNVEIGGGRITGMVSRPVMAVPIAFSMYHADQYAEPKGDFSKIRTVDGALWYTQLAQDAVERKPYKAPDDTVAYQESIVKRLPDPPKRKDRM